MDAQLNNLLIKESDEKWVITSINKAGEYTTEAFKGTIGQWLAFNTVDLNVPANEYHLINAQKVSDEEFDILYKFI